MATNDQPQPSGATRHSLLQAYDKAAAEHPGACGMHAIDKEGHTIALSDAEVARRKQAALPSGKLGPPL